MGGRHIREAGRARGGELRRAGHAVEERRHCAALHGFQRAVGAVRVAGGDAALSQPRNLGVELVAALHVAEAGRSDVLVLVLLDVEHLGAVAGCTVHAREVAGAVVQVQQQRLGGGAGFAERGEGVRGAVRRQRATRSIREEAGHGGGVAAEPQLGAEGAVLDPAGFADVAPLVLGGGADAVLDVRVVGAGQAQVLEGCAHHEGVGVHHVGVHISPGAVERVVGQLDEAAVLVAVEAHERVVQALSAVGDQLVVGAVVTVGVDLHGEGVFVGDDVPVGPGGDTEAQSAVVGVTAGGLQRGGVRGGAHVLQVGLDVAVD